MELEKHMRADSLSDKITHRPSPEELRQSASSPAGPSSLLALPAVNLHSPPTPPIFRKTSTNPSFRTLSENILPDSSAAPALQAQQKELEKHMRRDSLNEKISRRPPPEDLIRGGVLREDPRSPEERYEEAIEEEYAKREGGA